MSKLIKIVLGILTAFSVCMLLFRWGVIPPVFGADAHAEAKNEVMLNLSYSYLAGLIFYLLVTWLPYKERSRKMKPFISDKKAVIRGKIENCADGIIPTAMLLNHKPTRDELEAHLMKNSLLTSMTFTSLVGANVSILEHWRLQRQETKEHIRELLEFRDYLSDKELKVLGDLQNCQFFYDINGIFPVTDIPDVRKRLANSLWDAIQIARQL